MQVSILDQSLPNFQNESLVTLLTDCAKRKDLSRGSKLHAEFAEKGLLKKNVYLGSTLVNMYAKCGALEQARQVFDEFSVRDAVSWNCLIAGYAHHGYAEEALNCFERMQSEGLSPDSITFACSFKACATIGGLEKGLELHARIAKELHHGTGLVDMYAKCGLLDEAARVFDELPVKTIVSWNALMTGYAQHGHGDEALRCFETMQDQGFSPTPITLVCLLKACGSLEAVHRGQEVHAVVVREGVLERDIKIANALVDMYAKYGDLQRAHIVFEELLFQNVVSWTSLIAGYAQHGHGEEALTCLEEMQMDGVSPNAVTFVCSLKACGILGALEKGRLIHAEIAKGGLLEENIVIVNALVDMYAKCGLHGEALDVCNDFPIQDVVSWNVLMAGYAQLGRVESVFNSCGAMVREGKKPDMVTFTSVLNVCGHGGLLDRGELSFEIMSKGCGLIPTLDLHTCMVDLFCRAGQLEKAWALIEDLPFSADLSLWHTLLNGCRMWGNTRLARWAFQRATAIPGKQSAAYACMRNIFGARRGAMEASSRESA